MLHPGDKEEIDKIIADRADEMKGHNTNLDVAEEEQAQSALEQLPDFLWDEGNVFPATNYEVIFFSLFLSHRDSLFLFILRLLRKRCFQFLFHLFWPYFTNFYIGELKF